MDQIKGSIELLNLFQHLNTDPEMNSGMQYESPVKDSGIYIPNKKPSHIWRRFFSLLFYRLNSDSCFVLRLLIHWSVIRV